MDIKQWILLALIGLETAFAISRQVGKWDCPYYPVCGTDGVTYNNDCEFRLGKMENEDLQIMFDGPCKIYKMMNLFKMAGNKYSKTRPQRTQRYYPKDGDGRRVADSAALFHHGTLHGIANQNAATAENIMPLNAENSKSSHNNFKWIFDGQALGWSSILKNKFN